MECTIKEVYFDKYCETCKNKETKETEDPCNECLAQGWNENSHKPINWEESNEVQQRKSDKSAKVCSKRPERQC